MYSDKQLENLASDEFYQEYVMDGIKRGRKIEPTLQCFCLKQAELDETREDTFESEKLKLAQVKAKLKHELDNEDPTEKVMHDSMQYMTTDGHYVPTCSQYGNDISI